MFQVGTKEERLTKVIEEAETIHDVAAIAAQEELAAAQDAAAASAASSTGKDSYMHCLQINVDSKYLSL